MKVYQIEETIIAYFDGRLSDADSAELLHRVSISPEIRDIFEQHQLLRRMAVRAARNVSVAPQIEDAVFANIAALKAQENRKAIGGFWSVKRGAAIAGLALVLGAGIVASLRSSEPASVPYVAPSRILTVTSDVAVVRAPAQTVTPMPAVHDVAALAPMASHANIADAAPVAIATQDDATPSIMLAAEARTGQTERIQPPTVISHSISDLLVSATDGRSRFEIGLANSAEATAAPQSAANAIQAPFDHWAINAAYAIDESNLAGVRVEHGQFNKQTATSADATYYVPTFESVALSALGAYYEHRESIGHGGFMAAGVLGAGLLSGASYGGGNYITLGLGGRLPIGDHWLAGATVSLTRKHDGGQPKNEVFESASQPVIFDGAEIHNTLITRIEYGLSYRF